MPSSSYTSPEYTHCIRDARFRYNVYEPEADTFLFLEALDKDVDLLQELSPRRCIEVGCGSGTVITHLRCLLMPSPSSFSLSEAEVFERHLRNTCSTSPLPSATVATTAVGGPLFCAVDVNPIALEATGITWTDTLIKHFASPILKNHFRAVFHMSVPTTLAAPSVVETAAGVILKGGGTSGIFSAAPSTACESNSAAAATSTNSFPEPALSTYSLRRLQGDLFNALPEAFRKKDASGTGESLFDVVLFNPPYVPTSLEEFEDAVATKDLIKAAWCGGPRGRVVLDRFLQQLPSVMSRGGATYIVLIKENEVDDILAFAQRQFRAHLKGLGVLTAGVEEEDVIEAVEVAARYTGEHLSVYRLRYTPRYRNVSATL